MEGDTGLAHENSGWSTLMFCYLVDDGISDLFQEMMVLSHYNWQDLLLVMVRIYGISLSQSEAIPIRQKLRGMSAPSHPSSYERANNSGSQG